MGKLNKEIVFGLYDDETDLMSAVASANSDHMDIYDVYSPFPVHGLDPILGLEESRLHIAFAAVGMTVTFYIINGQGPGASNPILHDRISDDKFCIAFDTHSVDEGQAKSFFQKTGASLVDKKHI